MTSSEYKKHYRANRLLLITYYLTDKKDITVSDICLTHKYYYIEGEIDYVIDVINPLDPSIIDTISIDRITEVTVLPFNSGRS